ncbi:YbfB/YjiJ family MFS transporter [Kribbella sp. NPDC048915]|uniref:YbfB/YjiJ family MFS transporter n=1 Tax=Kribbella sp. NPDC048915 TaxID=3155148 RepID=UPI0033F22196
MTQRRPAGQGAAGRTAAGPTAAALAGRGAAALAGGMGIGRFAYTPILPLMHAQAGLSPRLGAALATANYTGYLAGALAAVVAPRLLHSRWALRLSLVSLTATLALMPVAPSLWLGLRVVAGAASALIFVIAVGAVLGSPYLGWVFGGVGVGIALSGAVLVGGSWRTAWWIAAVLTASCALPAWHLTGSSAPPTVQRRPISRQFVALLTSYTLEGIGYIIAGTFLVAAINETASETTGGRAIGAAAWIVVGVAAVPSTAWWARLGRRRSRSALLPGALIVQAVGIALPAIVPTTAAALVSAALFGATFLGVANLAIALGAELGVPHAIAVLTTGYSLGQIAGPLLVEPLLHNGYHQALLVSTGVVGLAAIAALPVRQPLRRLA